MRENREDLAATFLVGAKDPSGTQIEAALRSADDFINKTDPSAADRLQQEREETAGRIKSLELEKQDLEGKLRQAQAGGGDANIQRLRAELDDAVHKCKEALERNSALESEIAALNKEADGLKDQLAAATGEKIPEATTEKASAPDPRAASVADDAPPSEKTGEKTAEAAGEQPAKVDPRTQ